MPGFRGIELWSANCIDPIPLETRRMLPSRLEETMAQQKCEKLHPRFKEVLKDTPVGIYIVFSTS